MQLIKLTTAMAVISIIVCSHANASFVQSIGTLQNLRSGMATASDNVNVRGYAADNDGGGGQFVKNGSSCTDDDGTVIRDSTHSECWYRQFSGPVDIRWFGLGNSTTGTDILTQFGRAFIASESPTGNRVVTTGQLAITITGSGNLNIPIDDTLDCQGTIGGISGTGVTLPALPSSIVLTPPFRILANSRSTLKNCNVRPSWFTTITPTTTTRDLINILHQFSDTGVQCSDDGCSIQNVAVYGFDVGILADTSQRFYMNNVLVDANTGIWWRALPGAARNANLIVDPFITQGNSNKEEGWDIDGVSASGGECMLSTHTTNDVAVGDTVYVNGFNNNDSVATAGDLQSGNATLSRINPGDLQDVIPGATVSGTDITGGSKVVSVDRDLGSVKMDQPASGTHVGEAIHFAFANTGPAGCNGRWIVDARTATSVTLKGSSFTGPSTTGTWSIGSNVMTVTSLANIEPGQSVSGSGIPGGTMVVNVLPAANPGTFKVILSANASANGTGAAVSFGSATSFSGDYPRLVLSAARRVWTANPSARGANAFVTSGIGDGTTMTIGTVGDTTRIQPGMYISLDGSPIGNVTAVDDVNHTIAVQQIVSTGTHTLTLTGCGYPGFYGTKSPWLGNCAATAYLMGGPKADTDEDQGLGVVQAISKGWQVGFHLINALDTRCTGCQVNGNGSVFDRREFGIWFDTGTDETLWAAAAFMQLARPSCRPPANPTIVTSTTATISRPRCMTAGASPSWTAACNSSAPTITMPWMPSSAPAPLTPCCRETTFPAAISITRMARPSPIPTRSATPSALASPTISSSWVSRRSRPKR